MLLNNIFMILENIHLSEILIVKTGVFCIPNNYDKVNKTVIFELEIPDSRIRELVPLSHYADKKGHNRYFV